ncbi:MAG TPA: Gfo/Idh/MocA family oxidoreductase [Acidimicrobiales bacterium]|nr:Gfo/Idh/MocA family oxidoreductase [Acidimicrobiales bacterium]
MKPLRWGIISTGRIAHTFAQDLGHVDEGVVVAVGSRNLETAQNFANEFGLSRAYGSYEALVEDPDVDAVYVGTPHPMHLENALLALNHGKPVLVEKAFTMNADEARQLIEVARAKKLFVMEAMWTRFLPHVVALRDLIRAGALGELVAFEADHGKWFPTNASSRLFAPELGGSALLDLGIYPVSFASMLFGRPSRVCSLVEPSFTGVDGQVSMLFGYDTGAHAVLTCTSSARSATRACVTGREARIEIGGDFYAPVSFELITRDGEARSYHFDVPGRGLQFQAIEVARCLEAGLLESPVMPLDETLAIMETLDAVLADPQGPS